MNRSRPGLWGGRVGNHRLYPEADAQKPSLRYGFRARLSASVRCHDTGEKFVPSETPGEHLLRALRVTTSARFSAGHRLKRHETFSLWSISLASLFLIGISLLRPFGIPLRYSNAIVDLSQVVASAVILVVSLLVNGSKFVCFR